LIEKEIAVRTPDGTADGIFFAPEGRGPWPGVLFLTDIGGIRESQNEIARRVAGEGYAVLMPNLFYRTSRPPVLGMPFNPKDEKFTKRLSELASPLTPDAVERDCNRLRRFPRITAGSEESADGHVWAVLFRSRSSAHCGGLSRSDWPSEESIPDFRRATVGASARLGALLSGSSRLKLGRFL
jgi:hypothetical protein